MNKELTLREFIIFIVVIILVLPIVYPIYKDKSIKQENKTEIKENYNSSDLLDFNVLEMYKNSCLNQTYCPDGNNIYIKYGDYTFAVFKKENDDSILGILVSDVFKGHVLNDYSCEGDLCNVKYTKLNTETSGIRDVLDLFDSYLPSNKNDILNPIKYSAGYIDINNKYIADTNYFSYISLMNWIDWEEVGSRSYMFNIDTLLSTVRYAKPTVLESADHYWISGNKGRISGIYVSNGTRVWTSPLNREDYPIRPIISINSKAKISGGEGTLSNPYVI